MMTPLSAKILCAALAVLLSLFFGFLPFFFRTSRIIVDPNDPNFKKSRKGNQLLSFLLNFAGGTLLANCFCHWLPEVREGVLGHDIDTVLPLAEVIMCGGFFMMCVLEELLHWCIHQGKKSSNNNFVNRKSTTLESAKAYQVAPHDDETDKSISSIEKENSGSTIKGELPRQSSQELHLLSAIRASFVVFALSFHSVIEGLALGLEDDIPGIWVNFGALALHKFVIAFAVGIELVSVHATNVNYITSTVVFALAPAIGIAVGLLVTDNPGAQIDNIVIQVLQGLATGTIIYVVFFEIFPKAKEIGGSGFLSVVAMVAGFGAFLPSLLFHDVHDHGE